MVAFLLLLGFPLGVWCVGWLLSALVRGVSWLVPSRSVRPVFLPGRRGVWAWAVSPRRSSGLRRWLRRRRLAVGACPPFGLSALARWRWCRRRRRWSAVFSARAGRPSVVARRRSRRFARACRRASAFGGDGEDE